MMHDRSRRLLDEHTTHLVFFAVDWCIVDPAYGSLISEDDERVALSRLRITGVTTQGTSVCIDVRAPKMRMYLHDSNGCALETLKNAFIDESVRTRCMNRPTRSDEDDTLAYFRSKAAKEFDGLIVRTEILVRKYLQGIRPAAHFVMIECAHEWGRRKLLKLASSAKLKTANAKVEPLLDFRNDHGLTPSCWLRATGISPAKSSHVRCELYCVAKGVERVETQMTVPPLLLNSFDIETFSASGNFPNAAHSDDIITMIGCCLSRLHAPGTNRLVVFVAMPCAAVPGAEVRSKNNEAAMLRDFVEFMGMMHPEVHISFNGFGFDLAYIFKRAQKHGIDLRNMASYTLPSSRRIELVEKEKHDGRKLAFFNVCGSVNLDILIPIGDDYKLPSYKLDHVGEHFLGIRKVDLSPADLFHKTRPGASPSEVGEVATYCVRDVEIPLQLVHSLSLVLNKLAESDTVNTTLNDLITRGQTIKVFSYVSKLCHERALLIDDTNFHFDQLHGKRFEGAFVKEPLRAEDGSVVHCTWPIAVMDVASLYPSLMCCFNLCWLTHSQDDTQISPSLRRFEWVENGCSERHAFDQCIDGLLPRAQRDLRSKRQAVRRELATETDELRKKVLDAQQLSIKVVMNSIYGSTGAGEKSMLPNVPIAKTITYLGRSVIKECAAYVERAYGYRVIYIDTDSTYIEIKNVDLAQNSDALLRFAFELATSLQADVSRHIREHFSMVSAETFVLEAEDIIRGLLIPSKKRYCARVYRTLPDKSIVKGKLMVKGLMVKRRDSCKLFQGLFSRILEQAIDVENRQMAVDIIRAELDATFSSLKNGDVPMDLMTTSKALRATYEGTPPVHWFVAEKRRARGEVVRPGERVPFVFVVVKNEKAVKLQGDRAEDPAYALQHGLKIDGAFYIDSQITGPAHQLLVPFWPGVIDFLNEWKAKFRGQHSIKTFFQPRLTTHETTTLTSTKRIKKTTPSDMVPCEIVDNSDDD